MTAKKSYVNQNVTFTEERTSFAQGTKNGSKFVKAVNYKAFCLCKKLCKLFITFATMLFSYDYG